MPREATLVTIGRRPLRCLFCQGTRFFDQEIQLNTSGMELIGFGWANKSATGLICADCGYVHSVLSDKIRFWNPDGGFPGDDELAELEESGD